MELLIVRHAIAFEADARRWPDDSERPLSPQGLARARKAAAGMKQLVRAPGRVLVSSLVRARQTAAILVPSFPQGDRPRRCSMSSSACPRHVSRS